MGSNSSGPDFRHASIPGELAKEIVHTIRNHPQLGFKTLSEFCRHACILNLRQVKAGLALDALLDVTELGTEAVEAVIHDALPPEYRRKLEEPV